MLLTLLDKLVFGPWNEASTARVLELEKPGLYILSARTYGVKQYVGATHSFSSHLGPDGWRTLEVIDPISLDVMGYKELDRLSVSKSSERVTLSDRHPGCMWFGNLPSVILGPFDISFDATLFYASRYPFLHRPFNLFRANCNTFTSWLMHCLNLDGPNIGYGAREWKRH